MKDGNLSIVPMKRAHIRSCSKIVRTSEPWRTLNEKVDFSMHIIAKHAFVCLAEDRVVGFAIFSSWPVFARGGYLRALAVEQSSRGHGIGKMLLGYIEKETSKHSGNLYLCVSSFNRTARKFYSACGYVKIGSIPGLIRENGHELILWKRLVRTSTSGRAIR